MVELVYIVVYLVFVIWWISCALRFEAYKRELDNITIKIKNKVSQYKDKKTNFDEKINKLSDVNFLEEMQKSENFTDRLDSEILELEKISNDITEIVDQNPDDYLEDLPKSWSYFIFGIRRKGERKIKIDYSFKSILRAFLNI